VETGLDSCLAILVAAGRGQRFGGESNKVFSLVHELPVWAYSAKILRSHPQIRSIVLVISQADQPIWERPPHASLVRQLELKTVVGGQERVDSVFAGLRSLTEPDGACGGTLTSATTGGPLILVHDAARPYLSRSDLDSVLAKAQETGGAILARPLTGTIKRRSYQGTIRETVDRRELWEALTPQVFRYDWLTAAFSRWRGRPITDDAQLVQLAGYPVEIVEGSPLNIKITQRIDLELAAAILLKKEISSGG
jgi:2-C-methyl-D-erythritol 4-phosphate cytidylyltransferase